MPAYSVANLVLSSDVELPELSIATDATRAVATDHWALTTVPTVDPGPIELVFEHHTPAGTAWSQLAAGNGLFLLRFPGRADFVVRPGTKTVQVSLAPHLAESTLRHLVVDQLIPHILATTGDLVLHASAVEIDGVAVAFLGPSGAGKSSLAAAFVRNGASLLTDDYLRLREDGTGYRTAVAYPGLRLWEDSAEHFADGNPTHPLADYTTKRRLAVEERSGVAPVALGAIVALGARPEPDGPDAAIERLRGRDSFQVVFGQAFRVARPDAAGQQAELDRFIALAQRVPVFLTEYRRDYELLPTVIGVVLDSVRSALLPST